VCAIYKNGVWRGDYDSSFKRANLFLKVTYVTDNVIDRGYKKDPEVLNLFSKYVCDFSCIYLFYLGDYSEIDFIDKDKESIQEESYVYKFGMTNNIKRRTHEHMKTYNVYENVAIDLEIFAYIHNDNLHDAETKLRNYFKMSNMIVKHDLYKELVIIPKSKLPLVKSMYNDIYQLFTKE
jgi:hypothetical protein